MPRPVLAVLLSVFASLAGQVEARADVPTAAYDGQANHYRVRIDVQARRAEVDADLWLGGELLSMFNVVPVPGLPNGQADLIEQLQVRDAKGGLVPHEDLGAGDFKLKAGQRIRAHYFVRLDHDGHAWPAGVEEVSYHTDEGLMITGATLFLADGGDSMQGPITVEMIEQAKENLIQRRETHLDQLADKLREPRVHRVISRLIGGDTPDDTLPTDDLLYVQDLGLVTLTPQIAIANALYQEIIPRELTWSTQVTIAQNSVWYIRATLASVWPRSTTWMRAR